jgi:hypothetical protein
MSKNLPKRTLKENLTSEEAKSIYAFVEVTALAFALTTILKQMSECEDKGLLCETYRKAIREIETTLQALGAYWGNSVTPVAIAQLMELTEYINEAVKMERYKRDGKGYGVGELKGVRHLKQYFTPKVIKQFQGQEEKVNTKYNMIKEAVKTGDLDKFAIAEKVFSKWNEGDAEYKKEKLAEVEKLYNLHKTYGLDSELVDIILHGDGKSTVNNEERASLMVEYAKKNGVQETRKELLEMRRDRNLCLNPSKRTGCFVSERLWKDYLIAIKKSI